MVGGLYLYAQETLVMLYGEKTDATITAVYYDGMVGRFSDGFECSVHYTYQDKDLVSHSSFFYLPCSPIEPKWSKGDTVTIIIDPNDPTKAVVDNLVLNIIYSVGGFLILCILVAMLYVVLRRKTRLD